MKSRIQFSNQMKLTLCVVSLICTQLVFARLIGVLESHHRIVTEGRAELCESIAINFSLLVMHGDLDRVSQNIDALQARNGTIESLAVRQSNGRLLASTPNHNEVWEPPADDQSDGTQMLVPITSVDGPWGTVEVRFRHGSTELIADWLSEPSIRLVLYFIPVSLIAFYLLFRRVLRQLNPARVIPGRVRMALDTLTEGLLILDENGSIVLANESFGKLVGREPDGLLGLRADELPWRLRGQERKPEPDAAPWTRAYQKNIACIGELFDFRGPDEAQRVLLTNASPIPDGEGNPQGVLLSVDDVTELEEGKQALNASVIELRRKSDEIKKQNEQLHKLATTDPLTGCLNRRSFFQLADDVALMTPDGRASASCVMIDIDHFKSINDNHGHSVGDDVLRAVSAILLQTSDGRYPVCRFGGEEFCILLPTQGLDAAAEFGEILRSAIEAKKFDHGAVTTSVGTAEGFSGARDIQDIIDHADQALYAAKKTGRNRVVRFDNMPELDEPEDTEHLTARSAESAAATSDSLPFQAVTALLSTLSYRHAESAAHSRRVADLCVSVAESMMTPRQTFMVEIAALLHDIGKIAVPDSILLKPGLLTPEEREVMQRHDRIGSEIVAAALDCAPVTEMVSTYRAAFGGSDDQPGMPAGRRIPLGARLLSIADAWDSMTTDRSYRKAMTQKEAERELRRAAGTQFDPDLVERFIWFVKAKARATSERPQSEGVPRDVALSIGRQIERLVDAFEHQDLQGMNSLANRLHAVTTQAGLTQFADRADQLRTAIDRKADLLDVLEHAQALIELCRSTHSAWLHEEQPVAAAAMTQQTV